MFVSEEQLYPLDFLDLASDNLLEKNQIYIDHTPFNVIRAKSILSLINSRDIYFIHLIRDGRACYASLKKCDWGPKDSKKAAKHVVEKCGTIGDGFIILSEILVELYYNDFKISEIKTVWKNRVKGKSTVGLKEITASLIGLMRIYKKIDQIKHKNLK